MPDSPILFEIVLVFGAALAVIALSYRLRIPAVVGFLLAGILIGPYGLELVPDTRHVEAFAELAVALMLFVIGLELSSAEVRRLGRLFIGNTAETVLKQVDCSVLTVKPAGFVTPVTLQDC